MKSKTLGVELPTKPREPVTELSALVLLIYGEEGIGKTTLLSHFGRTLFLMTEPGTKTLRVYWEPIRSWGEFLAYRGKLVNDERFNNVVLDKIDTLFRLCRDHVCRRLGIDHPSDEEWGKGYDMVRSEFELGLAGLITLPKGVAFVSHAQEKEIRTRRGGKYHRIQPTCPNACRDVLAGICDVIGYYYFEGDDRYLRIVGDDLVVAKCRPERNFTGIEKIPMGTTSKEAYENFIAAFENRLQEGGPVAKGPLKKVRIK